MTNDTDDIRVVNAIRARVDRAGPHPVAEEHGPGLVHPDVNWLIDALAAFNSQGRSDETIIRHTIEITALVNTLRFRGRGPVNLVGVINEGFTPIRRSTPSEGLAKELMRLERAARSGSSARWIKAWAAATLECRSKVWHPKWPERVSHKNTVGADEAGPVRVGSARRGKPTGIGIEGHSLIGPTAEVALPAIMRARKELNALAVEDRRGNKTNDEAVALAQAIRAAILDMTGSLGFTDNRITGETTGPLAEFGKAFDARFGTDIRWRLTRTK